MKIKFKIFYFVGYEMNKRQKIHQTKRSFRHCSGLPKNLHNSLMKSPALQFADTCRLYRISNSHHIELSQYTVYCI